MGPMDDIKLSLDEVATLARSCLAAHGCDAANAQAVADTITQAERDGCPDLDLAAARA